MPGAARFVTWNVRFATRHPDGRPEPDALATACAALDADVLALQEVDRGTRRSGGTDLLAAVAAATGATPIDGSIRRLQGGRSGNALLVRGEVASVERLRFHRRWWPPWRRPTRRGALVAVVRLASLGEVVVANCHVGVGRADAVAQLGRTLAVTGTVAGGRPAAVLGDLNLRPATVAPLLDGTGFEAAAVPLSFPAHAPAAAIDHVLLSGLRAGDVEARWDGVSDHRAVVATVTVAPGQRSSASPRA